MADEGTTGDPVPPFDESFVLGGPHEPSHEERLVEAQRRAAAERVARLRAQQAASERRSARHPARGRLRPVRGTGGGRRTFRSPSQEGGSKIVAIVLIVVAVAGFALQRRQLLLEPLDAHPDHVGHRAGRLGYRGFPALTGTPLLERVPRP